MKVKCDKCDFEELPENYHSLCQYYRNQWNIFLVCPRCGEHYFIQHFGSVNPNYFNFSSSHLLCAPMTEVKTRTEAIEYYEGKLKEYNFIPPIELLKKSGLNTEHLTIG